MKSLFWRRDPYDSQGTDKLFLRKFIENAVFQFDHCEEYRRLLIAKGFTRERITKLRSPHELPFLPTVYLKRHRLLAVPEREIRIMAASSGTSGNKSLIGFDLISLWRGMGMVLALGRRHRLFSLMPSHYVILGYEYSRHERMAVMKTAYAQTWFAPALSRTYALAYSLSGKRGLSRRGKKHFQKECGEGYGDGYTIQGERGVYTLRLSSVCRRLIRLSRQKFPVRILGFPFYVWKLLEGMQKEGIRLKLPKGSLVAFGGGWKQHVSEEVDKETMYRLVNEVLGIPKERCLEFFGAVEHPVLYCSCPNHHFHVPVYSRVIIRDAETYEPVQNGTPGLVNLVTPAMNSMPVLSIVTDDLGILHDGSECGCGIRTPYLEILGRVGVDGITTCAAAAGDIPGGRRKGEDL